MAQNHNVLFFNVPNETYIAIKKELNRYPGYVSFNIATNTLSEQVAADEDSKIFSELWSMLRENRDFVRKLTYENVSLVDILRNRFNIFFSRDLPTLIARAEAIKKMLSIFKPSAVVVVEDIEPINRLLARICKLSSIPTLVIQHGVTGADMKGFIVMPKEAEKQAVWGNISKTWCVERGKAPDTQIITGNPRYDSIFSSKAARREQLVNELGLSEKTGVIVIATQWYAPVASLYTPEDLVETYRKLFRAVKQFPEKKAVVKLHPSFHEEYKELVGEVAEEEGLDDVVITERYLWELLDVCELLITVSSGAALEAMLLDKPVICAGPMEIIELGPYAQTEAVLKAQENKDLVHAIRDALYNKDLRARMARERREFVYGYVYLQDGRASQRVANLIKQMISHTSAPSFPTTAVTKSSANVSEGGDSGELAYLISLYHFRSDLQAAFPEVKRGSYGNLVNWASGVVNRQTDDDYYQILMPYGHWYTLMMVYDNRTDLQTAYPNAYVSSAAYHNLLRWAKGVVERRWQDSAYNTLAPYADSYVTKC